MPTTVRANLGGLVPIKIKTRRTSLDSRDGDLVGPYSVNVKSIKNPAGTAVVNNGSPIFIAEGELVYFWDTTGLAAGDYDVQIEFRAYSSAVPTQRGFIYRLLPQGAS
jgi:hypothetical protein